jgi:hypothetical protein
LVLIIELMLTNCPICKRPGDMVADHCHETGVSRERICRKCNAGLGMFMDDPKALRRAAKYIEKHEGRAAYEWLMTEHKAAHPRA